MIFYADNLLPRNFQTSGYDLNKWLTTNVVLIIGDDLWNFLKS